MMMTKTNRTALACLVLWQVAVGTAAAQGDLDREKVSDDEYNAR